MAKPLPQGFTPRGRSSLVLDIDYTALEKANPEGYVLEQGKDFPDSIAVQSVRTKVAKYYEDSEWEVGITEKVNVYVRNTAK